MKKILALSTLVLFLFSCGKEVIEVETIKKDFFVETKEFSLLDNKVNLDKTGKFLSSEDITVSSNALGRVKAIYVKEGETVKKGDVLVVLEDNIGNYGINYDKASNALDRAEINYDLNKISLDKQVSDAELNLKKIEKNLAALKDKNNEDIRKAELDLVNSDYINEDSKSSLDLQKMDNSIEKAKLDYENSLVANKNTISSNYNLLKKEYNSFSILLNDIIQFSDELIGVTTLNKRNNDSFEDYLGLKDTIQKDKSREKLLSLIKFKQDSLTKVNLDTEEGILDSISILDSGYEEVIDLLGLLETTINNSVAGTNFTETTIDGYISSVNVYQSSSQGNYSLFLAYKNSTNSFFKTYKQIEESSLKSIELLEKDREIFKKSLSIGGDNTEVAYNKTIISTKDSVDSLEIQLEIAKNSLKNVEKVRDATLRSLKNNINEANIALKQSSKEYGKLKIKAPINGTIGNIMVDKGQEIGNGVKVLNISNNDLNEIQLSFNKNELDFVNEGQNVFLENEGKTYTGSIYSISKNADSNLNYLGYVKFEDNIDLIGNIVSIQVPIEIENKLIALNLVNVNGSGIGTINILENGEIKSLYVKIGKIYGKYIEILGDLDSNLKLITNYVGNFDPDKFNLVEKN